nr:MAG TPA: hypothetical protein [Caudoviricetes sp.]
MHNIASLILCTTPKYRIICIFILTYRNICIILKPS